MTITQITPCPWCGRTDARCLMIKDTPPIAKVGCSCGAEGPDAGTEAAAWRSWNRRHAAGLGGWLRRHHLPLLGGLGVALLAALFSLEVVRVGDVAAAIALVALSVGLVLGVGVLRGMAGQGGR